MLLVTWYFGQVEVVGLHLNVLGSRFPGRKYDM